MVSKTTSTSPRPIFFLSFIISENERSLILCHFPQRTLLGLDGLMSSPLDHSVSRGGACHQGSDWKTPLKPQGVGVMSFPKGEEVEQTVKETQIHATARKRKEGDLDRGPAVWYYSGRCASCHSFYSHHNLRL